jgi:hypothetical protein
VEGPRVLIRNDDPNAAARPTAAILQTFVVQNDAPSAFPLGELSLRYYFTNDGLGAPAARCDETRAAPASACLDVEVTVFGLSPATTFADAFAEVVLPENVDLAAGARTGEVPFVIEPPSGAFYDQSNDYSFPEGTNLAVSAKVTLYRRGVLIWGREP